MTVMGDRGNPTLEENLMKDNHLSLDIHDSLLIRQMSDAKEPHHITGSVDFKPYCGRCLIANIKN